MRWWGRRDRDAASTLETAARRHLGAADAERWLALLRPAVRLVPVAAGEPVLARFGGRPHLPGDVPWPVWPGHGPLSFVGEVDLAALAATGLDTGLALPEEGRLLAFYAVPGEDDDEIVGCWDPATQAGARLLHVPGDREAVRAAEVPDGALELPVHELAGLPVATYPDGEHPLLQQALEDSDGVHDLMEALDLLDHAADARGGAPLHQVGGWAAPVQGPVELEVAELDPEVPVHQWRPLLQVDSDAHHDMVWGDVGRLYWLTRQGSSTVSRPDEARFTWQC